MGRIEEVRVPDIGDFDEVDVIEVLVAAGDRVEPDDSLITLESDKASMDVPAPAAGVVRQLGVAVGDKVGEGALVVTLDVDDAGTTEDKESPPASKDVAREVDEPVANEEDAGAVAAEKTVEPPTAPMRPPPVAADDGEPGQRSLPHASPSVRRLARELGADLEQIEGKGPKGRILKEDVKAWVKSVLTARPAAAASSGSALPPMPEVDFARYGTIESKPLPRIRRASAANLHRSWLHVPHVTQHDEADITDMESFRKAQSDEAKARGVKLTPVAFLMKATVAALKEFPEVNSSLGPGGETLILKRYYHLGVAVDTPNGLVVPVLRDVDQMGLYELAAELGEVSSRAREGKLTPLDLQGGTFSISSLGGIGGTAFTPIVNAPEVGILGVSRSQWRPVFRDGEFVPRLILPFCLSYDHRVVDGAQAVRFTSYLASLLSDLRRLLL